MLKTIVLVFFYVFLTLKSTIVLGQWTRAPSCQTITDSELCAQIGNKFYLVNGHDKLNWYEAQRYCRRHNANLATIENSKEMKLVIDYLMREGFNTDRRQFFISGNNLGQYADAFYSVSTGDLVPFTDWHENEPNNAGGKERCLEIWHIRGYFAMNDDNCDKQLNFICEFKERLHDQAPKSAVCEI